MTTATAMARKVGYHPCWVIRLIREYRRELKEKGLLKERQRGRMRRFYITDEEAFLSWAQRKGYLLPKEVEAEVEA